MLTLALMGWMLGKVAEHPGVPRDVGKLPPWFVGEPAVHGAPQQSGARAAVAEQAAAAREPAKDSTADEEFADFASGKIEIALTEYEMKPSKLRTRPGTVSFVLRNDGRFAHNFHLEGPGVEAHAEKFSPGRTVRLEVALQEGEYKISCPLSNHDQRGMHGTLVVTSKLAGK